MTKKTINLKSAIKKQFRSQRQIGKAPGTITYMGNREDGKYAVTVIDYSEDLFDFQTLTKIEDALTFKEQVNVTWFNVYGLSNEKEIDKLGNYFNINPLVLEDIVNTNQRPKIDEYDDYVFATLKMLYLDKDYEIATEHCAIILCENNVLLFQEIELDVFEGVRDRIKNKYGRIRTRQSDYLFFALIDAIIDQYFVVTENIAAKIDALEEEVYNHPDQATAEKIQKLKKEVLSVRKWVVPVKDLVNRIIESEHHLITKETKLFLRDALDHSIQIHENIQLYRELITNLMEVYMTNMSNKMNEVMKVLTIIATIFIPLTFIAGVYGMNFRNMPELEYRYGYHVVLGLMLVIFIVMVLYFKRKRWF